VRAPDRRTWHLAAAATAPDDVVASALEQTAADARRRAGVSAEAAALVRAAHLTSDEETRAHRLFAAALAEEAAGRFEQAERLLATTTELTADIALRADAVSRRSYLLFDRGEFEPALELATVEAGRAPPSTAAHILTSSGAVHALVHRLTIPEALAVARRAADLAGPDAREDPYLCHMLGWTLELSGRSEEALELARTGVSKADLDTIVAIDLTGILVFLEEHERARDLLTSIVRRARDDQAFGNLAYALDVQSRLELLVGRPTAAYTASLESIQLTEALGNDVALASALAWVGLVEAALGRSDDARAHGARSLELTQARGDRFNEVRALGALGLDALARGDIGASVAWLEPAAAMLAEGGVRTPIRFPLEADLVEAYARSGRRADADTLLARLRENAALTQGRWARAVCARCQALLADDADAEDLFESALEVHESHVNELERARTQLAYGERLRRIRRRRAARAQLRAALETFEQVGARAWAGRARAELRATGERLRPSGPRAHEQLTPQQLQVALAAAEGLTNKEIGARLFLSPKTVDFHLGQAYRKLEVRSRGELIKLFARQGAPVSPPQPPDG
jgi:DNA-binding CsgD family transcriptional regulator